MRHAALALLLCLPPQDVDRIDAFFARLDGHVAKLGRPSLPELAKAMGGDLSKVEAFLATLDVEPYAGVMKGAEGTLATRGGNSFDRALLAAALLPGKVRFAVGAGATTLKRAARGPRTTKNRDEIWARVNAEVDTLRGLLKARGVELGSETPASDEICWLEVERDGQWRPVGGAGEAKERFDVLPERYLHRIELSVRLERSMKGEVETREILKVGYAVKDLAGKPLSFQIVPAPGETGMSKALVAKDAVKASPLEGLRTVKRFVPSVVAGREGQYGQAFDLDGKIYTIDPAKDFALAGVDALGDRVGGLLSRGGGPGAPTALWYTVKRFAPGQPERSWEREVVDLTGFGQPRKALAKLDARQADRLRLAFLGRHDIHLHVGGLDMAEGLLRVRRAMEPWRGFFKAMREQRRGKLPLDQALAGFEPGEQTVTAFEVLRGTFQRDLGAKAWLPAAGIVILHAEIAPAGDKVKLRESFDIVDLPVAGEDRFKLGVLDTELELETCDCRPPMVNTASLIRKARPELRCLTKAEEVEALPYKPTAKARVKAEVEAGHVVIAPAVEIDGEAVWWRIDPRTGAALGIGETGYGQTATEYWLTVHDRIKETYGIGKVLYCYLMAIWNNPLGWDESAGVVASPKLLGDLLKCIPICKGLKKIVKFPEDEDPLAPFIGQSLEGEMKVDANDACKAGEDFLDKVLLPQ